MQTYKKLSIEQRFATLIVYIAACQQYCSALLHLIQAQQYCLKIVDNSEQCG